MPLLSLECNLIRIMKCSLLLLTAFVPTITVALNVVVVNQGGPETLALCTAKRCSASISTSSPSHTVSLVTSSDPKTQSRQTKGMYGRTTDLLESTRPPVDERVKLISTGEEIGAAIAPADVFVVVAHESPVTAAELRPAFSYASDRLKSVVLLSRQDAKGSKSGGVFGMGGKNYATSEEDFRTMIQEACSGSSPRLSILRCGALKGGGPGYSNLGGRLEGYESYPENGLSSLLYKNNLDIANSMTTISHDRFTLGLKLAKGDPHTMPYGFMISAKKDSFEASDTETNICTAAVVATALLELSFDLGKGIEVSLGCEKSEEFPTVETVKQELQNLA